MHIILFDKTNTESYISFVSIMNDKTQEYLNGEFTSIHMPML